MVSRKRAGQVIAICVFAVGMVGLYFLMGALKDRQYSDFTTYVISMVAFGAVCGIGHLAERMIYTPPAKSPYDPSPKVYDPD